MTEYDPRQCKRVVILMTEVQYETLWKMASRRDERCGIMRQVSVSKLLRSIADGKYRLVLRRSTNNVIRNS